MTDPAGARKRFEVGPQGALTAETDPTGATTRYTVNAAGLPASVVDPAGSATRVERDSAGRPIRLIDPLGAVTALEWNAEGWLVSQTGPDDATTRWENDPEGRLLRTVNPIGAATVFEPGPFDTLIARTGMDGVRHTFEYDTEQRLLRVSNPAGANWDYTYDPTGRMTSETDFNGRRLDYGYDAAGRLTARTTGTGDSVFIAYDAAGRMTGRATAEGDYSYAYDHAGRLATATGPGSTLTFEHDVCGRVVAETVHGRSMRYAYDAAGRRASRTTATGMESVWKFDTAGNPSALEAGADRLDFSFDATGQETERRLGPGTRLSKAFDAAGRLTAQNLVAGAGPDGGSAAADSVVMSRSWTWRADGIPEEIRDSLRGTRRLTSDAAGRVTSVSAHDWRETYAYDSFGNVAIADSGTTGDDAEPTLARRTLLQQAARTQQEFDDAGRVIRTTRRTLDGRRKTWRYVWNSQDQLIEAETPDHGTWRYAYDPIGRRVEKHRVDAAGAVTDQFLFTWDGVRLAEQTTTHDDGTFTTLTWDYDPGTFRPAAQRRRTWADEADQGRIDEAFHAIVTDLVGTPTELVTPDGHIAWKTTTTLWGHSTTSSADPDLDCPLRFPGQYHDDETGLNYNLHRYYDPDTAAYLTPDPLGLTAAPNDHAYVPNPLTWIDPFGLACEVGTQIDYNKQDDLIDATKARRLADGKTIGKQANYGAARLKTGEIVTGRSGGGLHTEEDLIQQAGGLHNIAEIYSERAPCAARCKPLLDGAVNNGNLTVKWSWRWNGPTSDVTKTIRAATNPAVKAAVNALPWP
ncbi:RHS repeat-associated core domain-containing protein [Catenulispora pinisilvae]|uniref:RHS repeat-associated core domain-containing protein n=1 Tax=Catenulispora pinisilvae TaxID=2705253 RepID=UPI001891FD0C|nr:RHS repeat-associated core domain-containing protein [Catenulispora pinisilvae]